MWAYYKEGKTRVILGLPTLLKNKTAFIDFKNQEEEAVCLLHMDELMNKNLSDIIKPVCLSHFDDNNLTFIELLLCVKNFYLFFL